MWPQLSLNNESGNGVGQAKNETFYTYSALNRLISAHDNYGNSTQTYTYDSLGNLTYETGVGTVTAVRYPKEQKTAAPNSTKAQ